MVLGSDVPLEEDILKKKIEFVDGWVEWATKNREQIILSRSSEGVIFTVPATSTLYITQAFLSATVPLGGTFSNMNISNQTPFLMLDCQGGTDSISATYPMPIKVEGGDFVQVGTGGVNTTRCGFVGFIVPKRLN